jgi:hypothetical protein
LHKDVRLLHLSHAVADDVGSMKMFAPTVPELKSSTQLAPRSARRFLGTHNFVVPEAAKAKPIPMLTTHETTSTSTFVVVVAFITGQGDVQGAGMTGWCRG